MNDDDEKNDEDGEEGKGGVRVLVGRGGRCWGRGRTQVRRRLVRGCEEWAREREGDGDTAEEDTSKCD